MFDWFWHVLVLVLTVYVRFCCSSFVSVCSYVFLNVCVCLCLFVFVVDGFICFLCIGLILCVFFRCLFFVHF